MKITKRGNDLPTLQAAFNMEGWDRTFEYESHLYVVISGTESATHDLSIRNGFTPCLNLKSRTIRGIGHGEYVKPTRCDVQVFNHE